MGKLLPERKCMALFSFFFSFFFPIAKDRKASAGEFAVGTSLKISAKLQFVQGVLGKLLVAFIQSVLSGETAGHFYSVDTTLASYITCRYHRMN